MYCMYPPLAIGTHRSEVILNMTAVAAQCFRTHGCKGYANFYHSVIALQPTIVKH